MVDRSVIITGANSGIGKAAAYRFAKAGYTLVMACRNIEKGEIVQKDIISSTGNEKIDLMELDTSSIDSIRSFCTGFKEKYDRLDLLIHNAAYFNHGNPFQLSRDQIELTFATNVLGPYLMTILLQESLKKSLDPRIVNAGSTIIRNFFNPNLKINFNHLYGEDLTHNDFSVMNSYRDSKMAFLMLTFRLADLFKTDGITVNMLEIKGAKMSKDTLQKFKPKYRLVARIQNLYFPTTESVAEIYYQMGTAEKFKQATGKLFNHNLEIMQAGVEKPDLKTQVKQLSGSDYYPVYAHNQATMNKVWDLCQQITGVYFNISIKR
jgi:NAD(P)-dependent dehydrogenase (short-subunit alcohol dehydrogenase family)